MTTFEAIALHLRQVYFEKNWTASCLKPALDVVAFEHIHLSPLGLNSIAWLAYHIGYYISIASERLNGGSYDMLDAISFDHPPLETPEAWDAFREELYAQAETFAQQLEVLDDSLLHTDFEAPKYGSYWRNVMGIVEHTHYHLGQLVLVHKIIRESEA